ncbi:MAG: flavin reductase family protein [Gammaproteobacteria bacterium]|nr:flavin reductase family protein [Gammaproteobacteria bacterium]
MSANDKPSLRDAFGSFLSGVTVVTALTRNGDPVGFTASSFASVSLEPPLVLVCPANSLSSIEVFQECKNFAVSVLAEEQQDIANIFASFSGDRFAQVKWQADGAGCPLIKNAVAWFSCTAHARVPAGDHQILIGHVDDYQAHGHAGLGYSRGGYFSLGLERQAAELPGNKRPVNVGAIIEHDDQVLMEETSRGLRLPQTTTAGSENALTSLRHYLGATGLHPEVGPVYSIFRSRRTGIYSTYYRCITDTTDTGGLGRYIPIDDLPKQKFANRALAVMLHRHALEHHSGAFGPDVAHEDCDVHVIDGDEH